MLALAIGPWEFVILLVVILVLFGGKRLGSSIRGLKRGAKEFKESITEDDEPRKQLPAPPPPD